MPRAVLGLGGNLGARRALLACARMLLAGQPGLQVLAASRLYHTPPLTPPQPDYVNAALLVDWVGSARALLTLTQHVEQLLRRQRNERWGARTLDIDILHWSEGAVREPGLTVPHPELSRRAFALVPLLEVAPELAGELAGAASADPNFAPSEPFVDPIARLADGSVRVGPVAEASELASAFVAALSLRLGSAPPARSVLPFACALAEADPAEAASLVAALHARYAAAFQHGFFVRNAAITRVGQGRCEGVFVGTHVGARAVLPMLNWVIESAGDAPLSSVATASKPSLALRIMALS